MELDTGETDVFLGQCVMLWEHAAGFLPSPLARQDLGIREGSLEERGKVVERCSDSYVYV